MRYFKLILIFKIILFLNSCGTVKQGFQNPKKENSDEFLVEKKSPLVMPPNFGELPFPSQDPSEDNESEENIKSLIVKDGKKKTNTNVESSEKEFEKSLLDKIKSN